MTEWTLHASPDGPQYRGPHGPMTILQDTPPATTIIRTPQGDATLEMDRQSRDEKRLEQGVPFSMPGAQYRLRRDGKRLVLEGPEGVVAVLHSKFRRRFVVDDGSGAEVLSMRSKEIAGELDDGVAAEHIALTLAVAWSAADVGPNRWGMLTPF